MGIKERIRKIIIKYLCCGVRGERGKREVKKIYDEISQTDDDICI